MAKKKYKMKTKVAVRHTLLDIIIPVHRRIDLLEKCLEAIPEAVGDLPYTVIIWDNATPKDEKQELYLKLKQDPKYIIVENHTNVGFPKACNLAVKRGKSPLIFLLNSDVILEPGSIQKLVMAMDDPEIGIVGMKLVFAEEEDYLHLNMRSADGFRPAGRLQHIGLATNVHGQWIHAYVGWDKDHPKVNAVREMYAVTGAALMTRRLIWRKAKGFYEGYGLGTYEDCDFCLTVREMGYNIIVVPEACGVHYTGATAETYNLPYPMNNNRMLFMQRWGDRLNYTELWSW